MASSIIELYVDVPADRQANIFGQFDEHLKLIERTLNVTMIFRIINRFEYTGQQ